MDKDQQEQELSVQGSWIPVTPGKPIVEKSPPICSKMEANQRKSTLLRQEQNPFCSSQEEQASRLDACLGAMSYVGANDVDNAEPTFSRNLEHFRTDGGNNLTEQGQKIKYSDLVKLASASLLPLASNAADSSFTHANNFGFNGQGIELKYTDVLQNGNWKSIPEWTTSDATSVKMIPQFAPMTPDKATYIDGKQVFQMQSLRIDCMRNDDKVKQDYTLASTADDKSPKKNEELSWPEKDSSLAPVSTPVEQNHNPDKGLSNADNLIGISAQKQRRRRHRPKVINEGKRKRTPKPVTPNPLGSNVSLSGKRKYVRKNGISKLSSTSPTEVTEESNEEQLNSTKKSCRRKLDFDQERQPGDESSQSTPFSLDSKSRTCDSLVEKILLRSNMEFGNEIHKTVETTQTHISCDLNHCANQMLNSEYKHYVRRPQTTKQVNTIGANLTGTDQNVWAANQMLHCFQFPNIKKKKRTKNGERQEAKFSQSFPENLNASEEHDRVVVPGSNISFTAKIGTEKGICDSLQSFVGIMPLFMTEGMTKKRTKGTKRGRSSTSLTKLVNSNFQSTSTSGKFPENDHKQKVKDSCGPQTCIDALTKPAKLTRKKQTRKMKSQNASYSGVNIPQQDLDTAIYKDRKFFYKTLGDYSSHLWDQMLETVTELFDLLYIDEKCRKLSYEKHRALVPYDMQNQNHNALVIYKRDGTIVPVKKRRPRPKVELDEETDKVWKLLMVDINSTGIDGTDEEKAKWWEEERRVFQGRADSFIARMRLVQGDRRFSKWKGSVLDSVVGVFLTQNVSDHLSSSAFMSLAAHFPNGSQSNYKECNQDETNIFVNDQEAYLLNPEDNMIQNKQFVCPSFREPIIEVHDHEGNEEIVSSNESLGSNYQSVISQNESTFKPLSGSESVLQICDSSVPRKPMTGPVVEEPYCLVEGRATYDLISSSIYLISSQDSEISSISQTDDIDVVCLGSNSIQDRPHWPLDNDSISSVKKVQMPEANMLQAVDNQVSVSFSSTNQSDDAHDLPKRMDNGNQSDITQGIHKSHLRDSLSSSSHQLQGEPGEEALANDIFESQREETQVFTVSNNRGNGSEQKISTTESASVVTYQNGLESDNIWKEQNMSPGMLMKTFQNFESPDALSNNTMREGPSDYSKETLYVAEEKTESISQNQYLSLSVVDEVHDGSLKVQKKQVKKQHKDEVDWDRLRKQTEVNGRVRERTTGTMDSLDWEAVRCAEVKEIADTIKERGMNNVLAGRIKDFLNRIVKDHGSIDLEWLRDVSPDQAKEYLLSIRGLGLKSVECVRLLTLHHLAFPVDTNVGRIAVRLGWVPLQPLPESLQLHLLELYPVLETIQKYLWPRLCKLDQKTLYELHYQMITFGKVFCTKNKPNCNSCPMRGECRHFASAFASARLALPAPEEKSMVCASSCREHEATPAAITNQLFLSLPHATKTLEDKQPPESSHRSYDKATANNCEPIIEEPTTPEPERDQVLENDIEDASYEDPDEIPTIKLNIEAFTQNLQNYMQENMELQESDLSRALIALTPEVARIPAPKLKNISRLRTEHQVYELPDSHPLLKRLKMERREPDDPSLYLLAIWTPGETADSTQPPESRCSFQESGNLCWEKECFSCNSVREANSQTVRGTILIPCRTAMRGSFPLNGTYFQVNEVFADHDSSLIPIDVPRAWIWNLARRTVYFGTSIPTIFKGLSTEGIQHCFWRGYVCVRGFDQKTRAPRPLMARLHFPASKLTETKGKNDNK